MTDGRLAKYARFYGQVDAIVTMECRNEIRPETALQRLREIVRELENELEHCALIAKETDSGVR